MSKSLTSFELQCSLFTPKQVSLTQPLRASNAKRICIFNNTVLTTEVCVPTARHTQKFLFHRKNDVACANFTPVQHNLFSNIRFRPLLSTKVTKVKLTHNSYLPPPRSCCGTSPQPDSNEMSALESVKCPAAPRTHVHNDRPHILSLNGVNKQSEKLQIQARVRKTKPPALLISERLSNIYILSKNKYQTVAVTEKNQSVFLIKQPFGHSYNAK